MLTRFSLDDLAPFKQEKQFAPEASKDMRCFYAGRDNVHGVLLYLLSHCSRSFKFNMYGYDDPALDQAVRRLVESVQVYVQGTLDKSEAGSEHERRIIAGWSRQVRSSFAIGKSATDQLSHTKGGVFDSVVAFEGSVNWSATGEGWGPKAQNNTLVVYTNPVEVREFTLRLDEEHATALQQERAQK